MKLEDAFLESLGVVDWGYTEESKPRSFQRFSSWVDRGEASPLNYLTDHRRPLRDDLCKVYPEFQSALVFLFSYRPAKKWLLENDNHRVAAYALGFDGEDYHVALKKRLQSILEKLQETNPELRAFQSLDAQPVLERDLAYRAGLGWFGKNSMLISRKEGSYFIIGSLLLNQRLGLATRSGDVDHCGSCRACADACPTDAIDVESRTLVATKCISTFTIEVMKDAEPPEGMENGRGEIFGCDICQDVCPWNSKPLSRENSKLDLAEESVTMRILRAPLTELRRLFEESTGRGVQRLLEGTALARPGKRGWSKNLKGSRRSESLGAQRTERS